MGRAHGSGEGWRRSLCSRDSAVYRSVGCCTPSQAPGTKAPPKSHLLLLGHGAQVGLVFCLNGPKDYYLELPRDQVLEDQVLRVVPATLERWVL